GRRQIRSESGARATRGRRRAGRGLPRRQPRCSPAACPRHRRVGESRRGRDDAAVRRTRRGAGDHPAGGELTARACDAGLRGRSGDVSPRRPPHRDDDPHPRRGRGRVRPPRLRTPGWARSDALLPLSAAYFAFAAYYVWQAWRRDTPAIFTDELELTQISRAIAHTGHPARRGVPYHFTSLYPYFTAPAWWLHATQQAFDTIKYLGVLAMTAAIFPAYGIARVVLSPRWAVTAAVGAIAAPALSYSPILVEEPLAYPVSTLA